MYIATGGESCMAPASQYQCAVPMAYTSIFGGVPGTSVVAGVVA